MGWSGGLWICYLVMRWSGGWMVGQIDVGQLLALGEMVVEL